MIRLALAIGFAMMMSPSHAQLIRDMSLTPQETLREPDVINPDNDPLQGGTWSDRYDPSLRGTERDDSPRADRQAGRFFMDGYCGDTMQPIIRNRRFADLSRCIEDTRSKACDGFRQLPPDAKPILDEAAECGFILAESADAPLQSCARYEQEQLRLLKKYWSEPDIAYYIAFMPDMVSNPTALCMQR